MTDEQKEDVLLELNRLREILNGLMQPEVLRKFADLREALGSTDEDCYLNQYEWLLYYSDKGSECTYTKAAKHHFLEENGDNVIELIRWLYENWAKEL